MTLRIHLKFVLLLLFFLSVSVVSTILSFSNVLVFLNRFPPYMC